MPTLDYTAESGLGRILREVRAAALERCPARSVFKAHLASVLRTMALDGRGMAWLPQTLISEDLVAGRLVEAAPQDWFIEMEIRLYRDRSPLGTAAEQFWNASALDMTYLICGSQGRTPMSKPSRAAPADWHEPSSAERQLGSA